MRRNYSILVILAIALISAQCQHEPFIPADPTPTVTDTIDSTAVSTDTIEFGALLPEENAVFAAGEGVFLYAEATCNELMHGYQIEVVNLTTAETVFQLDVHEHANQLYIEEEWVNNVTVDAEMEVHFLFKKSHEGEGSSRVISFKCLGP